MFKDLAFAKLRKIESMLFMKEYSNREVIFKPGDKNRVFIVKTGRVEVYQLNPSGKKMIIEILKQGSILGDLGYDSPTDIFVEATVNSCVCSLDKNKFFSLVSQYPKLSEKLMKNLFNRLINVEKRMSSLASDNAFNRLVKLLLTLGKTSRGNLAEISDKFTHEELSQMLGISRQTVTTIINQLEKKGYIKRINRMLQFIPQKLEKLAN